MRAMQDAFRDAANRRLLIAWAVLMGLTLVTMLSAQLGGDTRLAALPLWSAGLLLAGCQFWYNDVPSPDDAVKRVPWFDHMIQSRAVFPYQSGEVPRTTVPGTVPITGAEPDWRREFLSGVATTADRLVNPAPGSGLARGDTLYQFFCSVCHGPAGAGNGTVGMRMGAPSLLTERARGFSDGYLYSIIRYGRGLMPRYGDKIHELNDRWAVVDYLRQLQQ